MSRRVGSRTRSRSPWMNSATFRSSGLSAYDPDISRSSMCYTRNDRRDIDLLNQIREDRHCSSYSSRLSRERDLFGSSTSTTDELIRSRNLQVQIANSTIVTPSRHVEIHPKISPEGRYPPDFDMPMQLGALVYLSESRLDRILIEYGIFTDEGVYRGLYARTYASELGTGLSHQNKFTKIAALLDFLGANRLAAAMRRNSAVDYVDSRRTVVRGRLR